MNLVLIVSLMTTDVPQGVQPNWLLLGRGKDGVAFFVDETTVQQKPDGIVEAWTRRDAVPGSKYAHEKVLISFNCAERTSKYVAAITYLADGSIGNDRYKPEKRFLPVIPNSMDWVTMEHVCKLSKPVSDL